MSYTVQDNLDLPIDRTATVAGLVTTVRLSNVKIKRPDGTWAEVLQVTEVHLRLPDGTWEVFT